MCAMSVVNLRKTAFYMKECVYVVSRPNSVFIRLLDRGRIAGLQSSAAVCQHMHVVRIVFSNHMYAIVQ